MARAYAWWRGNDMLAELSGLVSSTDTSSPVNNSTGVTVSIWCPASTSSSGNLLLSGAVMGYVAGSDGDYRYTAQSTSLTPTTGRRGMAIITLAHSGLNGEWRVPFRVERRGTT